MQTVECSNEEIQLKPAEFKLFQTLMYDHAGIRLSERKQILVQSRLRKRLTTLGLDSYRAYYNLIISQEDEFQTCLNALTTNETFFFRHKNHWDFLTTQILPDWRARHDKTQVYRAWSAASSSGEEPYSLAIALRDSLKESERWDVRVDATDINEEVLAKARRGEYGSYALQKLTPACIKSYFRPAQQDGNYVVKDRIRDLVQFRRHNLLHATSGAMYDLILLRNVMIYFDEASKAVVLATITRRLTPGGYLFLGGSETLPACKNQYDYVKPTVYRRR